MEFISKYHKLKTDNERKSFFKKRFDENYSNDKKDFIYDLYDVHKHNAENLYKKELENILENIEAYHLVSSNALKHQYKEIVNKEEN
jgi:hypothetical protein